MRIGATPIRVAPLDDHRVVTCSLRGYFELFADIAVVGTSAFGEDQLARVDARKPRIVVVDHLLPGGIDGIETTRRIRAQRPEARVAALTASTEESRMLAVLRGGGTKFH